MSRYVPIELQGNVRAQFANACAYCRSAEELMAVTFEIEHSIPFALEGSTAVAEH